MNQPALAIDHILGVLEKLPVPQHYWLAYSGGIDSTALLSILSRHRDRLGAALAAVHINHRLSAQSEQWEKTCRAFCNERNIRYETVSITMGNTRQGGLEARARELRYAALATFMRPGDVLLTAHHKDDLAETVIQQLLRGSGPEGLAAIPEIRRFGPGWLARPLLAIGRDQIAAYVAGEQLAWVEDESNTDQGLDRNYIRNTIMPSIRARWPAAVDVLCRASGLQADAVEILHALAAQDLAHAQGSSASMLRISALAALSLPRKRNLLRYWIKNNGHAAPAMNVLDKIIYDLVEARPDSMPRIHWKGTEIRRYRDNMYIMPAAADVPSPPAPYRWSLDQPLRIGGGSLKARLTVGSGIRNDLLQDNSVEIRFRKGGECIRPAGRKETHELKKLFQETAVPPWERDSVPLVYVGDDLAAVAGYWIADGFNATGGEQGWEITYTKKRD